MNNEYEYKYEYNFFCKKMNRYSFDLNKYICEYDYIYFRFYLLSVLLLAKALKLFVSFWYL